MRYQLRYVRMKAVGQTRTGHLVCTGDVLYPMSYDGVLAGRPRCG